MCPVIALQEYLNTYPHITGPLFQFKGGSPVNHAFVATQLVQVTKFIGLNPAHFKGHSFRIGAATQAAILGYSDSQIQKLGRWNSNAMRRYIRICAFDLMS